MFISKLVVRSGDNEYTIDIGTTDVRCSCPAFTYGGGGPCKHIRYVAKQLARKA